MRVSGKPSSALSTLAFAAARIARDVEEREAVARSIVELVERLLGDAGGTEQRVERAALVDASDDEVLRFVRGGAHGEGVADGEIPILGDVVRQERAVEAELREHLVRAVHPAEVVDLGNPGVQAGEVRAVALDLHDVLADVADGLDAVDAGNGGTDGSRELGVAVLRGDDQVGLDLALDRVAVRHAQAVGEHGDERHERDPDHQGSGGGGRAARVALRVPLGDRPGRAAHVPRGETDQAHERTDEPRGEHRDPDEQREDADAEQGEPVAGADAVRERPVGEREHRKGDDEARDVRREVREPPARQRRAFSDRRDRRHPRRANRREETGDQRHERPDEQARRRSCASRRRFRSEAGRGSAP